MDRDSPVLIVVLLHKRVIACPFAAGHSFNFHRVSILRCEC